MDATNPFSAPVDSSSVASTNVFDSIGTQPAPPAAPPVPPAEASAPAPDASANPFLQTTVGGGYAAPTQQSPYGQPAGAYAQAPVYGSPYGVTTPSQQPPPVQAQPPPPPQSQPAPQPAYPYQQQPPPPQPQAFPTYEQPAPYPGYPPQTNSMVVSEQQSNPYATMLGQQPPAQPPAPDPFAQQQQALVPSTQQSNQWGIASSGGYDAYGAAPGGGLDFFGGTTAPPPQPPAPQPPAPAPQPRAPYGGSGDSYGYGGPPPPVSHSTDMVPHSGSAMVPKSEEEDPNEALRNRYRGELARQAPPGASPLPKAELVRKKGFVLSRISFRTIVMKKWKQAYWVQYGPHTMLWFRSQSDFEDWLSNPYHNQVQRNFLIKLAVNFVHDLYKPNVRGYQVTQCRTKAYGTKMVRQFKLERWMDYGPTIAAAFGAYDPKEVDALREALVECMRNTPLTGGIRATGAVRQPGTAPPNGYPQIEAGPPSQQAPPSQPYQNGNPYPQSGGAPPGAPPGASQDSVAEETDLLDLDNWDDVPTTQSQQSDPTPGAAPYGAPSGPQYGVPGAPPPYGAPAPAPYGAPGGPPGAPPAYGGYPPAPQGYPAQAGYPPQQPAPWQAAPQPATYQQPQQQPFTGF